MKQLYHLASCLLFISLFVFASAQPEMMRPPMPGQSSTSGTIMGMIVDENAKPIEYASIYSRRGTTDCSAGRRRVFRRG